MGLGDPKLRRRTIAMMVDEMVNMKQEMDRLNLDQQDDQESLVDLQEKYLFVAGPPQSGRSSLISAMLNLPSSIEMALTDQQSMIVPLHIRHSTSPSWTLAVNFRSLENWSAYETRMCNTMYEIMDHFQSKYGHENMKDFFEVVACHDLDLLKIYPNLRDSLRLGIIGDIIHQHEWLTIQPKVFDMFKQTECFLNDRKVPEFLTLGNDNPWSTSITLENLDEFQINLLIYLFGKIHHSDIDAVMYLLIVNTIASNDDISSKCLKVCSDFIQAYLTKLCSSDHHTLNTHVENVVEDSCQCSKNYRILINIAELRLETAQALGQKHGMLKKIMQSDVFRYTMDFWPLVENLVLVGPVEIPSKLTVVDVPSYNPFYNFTGGPIWKSIIEPYQDYPYKLWYTHSSIHDFDSKIFSQCLQQYGSEKLELIMTHSPLPSIDAPHFEPNLQMKFSHSEAMAYKARLITHLTKHMSDEDQAKTCLLLEHINIWSTSSLSHCLGNFIHDYLQDINLRHDGKPFKSCRSYHSSLRDYDDPTADQLSEDICNLDVHDMIILKEALYKYGSISSLKSSLIRFSRHH